MQSSKGNFLEIEFLSLVNSEGDQKAAVPNNGDLCFDEANSDVGIKCYD